MNGLGWFDLHVMLAPGVLSVLVRKLRFSLRLNLVLHFSLEYDIGTADDNVSFQYSSFNHLGKV